MKQLFKFTLIVFSVILFFNAYAFSQGEIEMQIDKVGVQMDLIDTRLELLNTRLQMLESKPPDMDSLVYQLYAVLDEQNKLNARMNKRFRRFPDLQEVNGMSESYEIPRAKFVVSMLPVKLFEGSMELAVERALNKGNSLELSVIATYATSKGIARYYMSNQSLEYYDLSSSMYIPYTSENISGLGGSLSWRNYLLARTHPEYQAPGGLYAAPTLMFRRLTLSGFDRVYNEEEDIMESVEVTQRLNVFSGGFLAGWQFLILQVVTLDVYMGGMIRLSKYDGEEGFTRYKALQNVDYSGVMPTIGIKVGIVK